MYCLRCGQEIEDDAVKCPYCDCPTENKEEAAPAAAPAAENTVQEPATSGGGLGVAGIILGSVGIFLAWVIALFGYALGGAGLALSIIGRVKAKNAASKVGIVLSAIALGCAFINSVVGVIIAMGAMSGTY